MKTTEKIRVNETQFKILHLLNNIPIEQRTASFLSGKLSCHVNTIRTNLQVLEAIGLVKVGEAYTGRKHYFLKDYIKNNVSELCCCDPPVV